MRKLEDNYVPRKGLETNKENFILRRAQSTYNI